MTTQFLTNVQETALARWVAESSSLLGYPTILVFHTLGLALLVGSSVAVNLRLLGVARRGPLAATLPLFRLMWTGLVLNGVSGVLLFVADAVHKAEQRVFWIKLACVAGAMVTVVKARTLARSAGNGGTIPAATARGVAWTSLALWTGAIIAGRLMAYL